MFDPELPRGFQDADFEMMELQDAAKRERRLKKFGICTHGWYSANSVAKCNECGKVFATETELLEDRRENLM